ncbi:16S rRNA (guanine(527)-N(7))-methyltransferase RsmG [candidate division KSB1 bacterium]|nr:16S rRNA (guanine(527)-N(7))-methyltransferase RsmG [candidate division KSB1 bacterium]
MLSQNKSDLELFFQERSLTTVQQGQFTRYVELIERWQGKVHLVSKADIYRLVSKHIRESLWFADRDLISQQEHVLDLGSGAGFPGIPIKILYPEIHITLVESKRRKALFLQQVCADLNIRKADIFTQRMETLSLSDLASPVDVVVARAVAGLEILWSWSVPVLAGKGRLMTIKGKEFTEQVDELQRLFPHTRYHSIPLRDEEKYLIVVQSRAVESL